MHPTKQYTPLTPAERDFLGPRLTSIVQMVETHGYRYSQIGRQLGISGTRISQLYRKARHRLFRLEKNDPLLGLSVRALNICHNAGLADREQILHAIKTGELHPARANAISRNYGRKTQAEMHRWLGLPDPRLRASAPLR